MENTQETQKLELKGLTYAKVSSLSSADQNILACQFYKMEQAAKNSAASLKNSYHDAALVLVVLEKRADEQGVTTAALYRMVTKSEKAPDNHAQSLAKVYRLLVIPGHLSEDDWRKCKYTWLELASRVLAKSTEPETIKKVAEAVKDRSDETPEKLKAMLPKTKAEKTGETPIVATIEEAIEFVKEFVENSDADKLQAIWLQVSDLQETIDRKAGADRVDTWAKEMAQRQSETVNA